MSWTRYQPSSSQSFPPDVTEEGVTPFSRYPRQDGFYNTLAYSHVVISFAYLAVMLWQFLAPKGTPEHVRRGLVLKWIALFAIGGGWVLQIRHALFSDPKIFEKTPVLYSLPFQWNFINAFGTSTIVSALNCFLVGVKEKSRMASCGGPWHLFLLTATSVSLAVDVNAYFYIFREMSTTPAWANFHWDMLVEMIVIGAVFPIYDFLNLYVLSRWYRTGFLDYVEHHVMNAIWTMTKTLAAVLLFVAHDSHFFWPHPGITLLYRWAVQLLPQLPILLPYLPRIIRYVAATPDYKPVTTQVGPETDLACGLQKTEVNGSKA